MLIDVQFHPALDEVNGFIEGFISGEIGLDLFPYDIPDCAVNAGAILYFFAEQEMSENGG